MNASGRQSGATFGADKNKEEEIMVSALAHVIAGGGRKDGADYHHLPTHHSEPESQVFSHYADLSVAGSPSLMHGQRLLPHFSISYKYSNGQLSNCFFF